MTSGKDIHGFVNIALGVLLAVFAGIYHSQLPVPLAVVVAMTCGCLMIREAWVLGGQARWAVLEARPARIDAAAEPPE